MAPTRRPSDGLLARVNFPLYAMEMLTSRHVLVGGGGGSSKTGVANGFEIYEIYHNGTHFCAEEVTRHETGGNVVMNFAVKSNGNRAYICAGQESHCQMYSVNPRIIYQGHESEISSSADKFKKSSNNEKETEDEFKIANNLRKRNNPLQQSDQQSTGSPQQSGVEVLTNGHGPNTSNPSDDPNANLKRIRFDIRAADSVQTDFLKKSEPLQRVVRISGNGRLMATGGTDGHLRIWSFPQMVLQTDFFAHGKEIDDIDFSPDSKYIISIAKDGQGIVWNLANGKELYKLNMGTTETLASPGHSPSMIGKEQSAFPTSDGQKYLYKRCRYGTIEAQRDKYRLFTIANPLGKVGKQTGYLQQWDCNTGKLKLSTAIPESLASLAVRDDGRFVAVGTMFTGSISMYIAFSLQRVLHIPNAHSMFVTGLQFLPITNEEGPPISSDTEAAVLSISVDNKVCIHSLQHRRTIPAWMAIIILTIALVGTFILCSYLGI